MEKKYAQESADYVRLSLMRLEERRLLSADALFAIYALDAVKPEGNGYQTPYTFEVVRTGDPHSTAVLGYRVTGAGGAGGRRRFRWWVSAGRTEILAARDA